MSDYKRKPGELTECPICHKMVKERGLLGHKRLMHEGGFAVLSKSADVQIKPPEAAVIEKREDESNMAGSEPCPHCTAKDLELNRLRSEVIPGVEKAKTESEGKVKELTEKVASLTKALSEKPDPPADHAIPEDLEEVIAHCESGACPPHAQQWAEIQQRVIEANKPAIIKATLDNLPDSIVETEGLKRGFIPQKIILPMSLASGRGMRR